MIHDDWNMNSKIATHLSEEELDEVLLDGASAAARQHLDGCEECRTAVASFEMTLESFNQASMAWSEAKSNTLNRDLSQVKIRTCFTPATIWSCAAAALVVIALVLFSTSPQHPLALEASNTVHPQLHANSNAAINDRAREIADDNALLGAIDYAIRPQTMPASLFEPTQSTGRQPRSANGEEARD